LTTGAPVRGTFPLRGDLDGMFPRASFLGPLPILLVLSSRMSLVEITSTFPRTGGAAPGPCFVNVLSILLFPLTSLGLQGRSSSFSETLLVCIPSVRRTFLPYATCLFASGWVLRLFHTGRFMFNTLIPLRRGVPLSIAAVVTPPTACE